ncbi:hypothetical protein NFJ02_11g05490 [Pycnococcus provasolii]
MARSVQLRHPLSADVLALGCMRRDPEMTLQTSSRNQASFRACAVAPSKAARRAKARVTVAKVTSPTGPGSEESAAVVEALTSNVSHNSDAMEKCTKFLNKKRRWLLRSLNSVTL